MEPGEGDACWRAGEESGVITTCMLSIGFGEARGMTGDGHGAIRRARQRGHRDHIRFSPQACMT